MFDTQLAAVAAASTHGDGVLACARLENAACAARLGHMADLLAAAFAEDGSADREQWCFDNWSAVCAQIGAAHAVTSGVANGFLTDAVVLRERLPQVADVFAAGDIGYRLVHQICARTGLVRDCDTLAVLDATRQPDDITIYGDLGSGYIVTPTKPPDLMPMPRNTQPSTLHKPPWALRSNGSFSKAVRLMKWRAHLASRGMRQKSALANTCRFSLESGSS